MKKIYEVTSPRFVDDWLAGSLVVSEWVSSVKTCGGNFSFFIGVKLRMNSFMNDRSHLSIHLTIYLRQQTPSSELESKLIQGCNLACRHPFNYLNHQPSTSFTPRRLCRHFVRVVKKLRLTTCSIQGRAGLGFQQPVPKTTKDNNLQ